MTSLSWDAVLAWRLRRQHLAERAPRAAALDVVADIGGLHAQVASSAELTLWARVEDLEAGEVERLLWDERALVKTWAMRGTLHLLRADELGRYVGALSRLKPRHHVPAWLRHHGLERAQADAMLAAIPVALDGEPLTREELAARVAELVGDETLAAKLGGGFGDLLKPAAFTGELCFAPSDGRLVRFTAPRRRLRGFTPPGPDEAAAAAIVRTYLAAYGPAPREQFQRWFGMTSPAEAGRWIRALGDEVAEVDVEGARGWMLAADVDAGGRRRARGRRAAAAGLRPVRRRRAAGGAGGPGRRAPRGRLPPAGLALAGGAPGRAHGRDLGARAQAGRDRGRGAPVRAAEGTAARGDRGRGRAPRRVPRRAARADLDLSGPRTSVRATQPSRGRGPM